MGQHHAFLQASGPRAVLQDRCRVGRSGSPRDAFAIRQKVGGPRVHQNRLALHQPIAAHLFGVRIVGNQGGRFDALDQLLMGGPVFVRILLRRRTGHERGDAAMGDGAQVMCDRGPALRQENQHHAAGPHALTNILGLVAIQVPPCPSVGDAVPAIGQFGLHEGLFRSLAHVAEQMGQDVGLSGGRGGWDRRNHVDPSHVVRLSYLAAQPQARIA